MHRGANNQVHSEWTPPGRDCGACGVQNCETFSQDVEKGIRKMHDCPFYQTDVSYQDETDQPIQSGFREHQVQETDILGNSLDFVIGPLPGEPSARKFLLPFRPDLVERWDIKPGDIITGRPMGAGCPVQHVIRVFAVSKVSGVITGHVVGPAFSRGHVTTDLEAYHMIGFEGIAHQILKTPEFGRRMRFLPGFCMMNIGHTGVINMVLGTKDGLRVRVEDIVIQ